MDRVLRIFALFGCVWCSRRIGLWLILRITGSVPATGTAIEPTPNQNLGCTRNGGFGIGLAAVGLLLAGAVAAIPSITRDRTCHKMFRDGRTSIGPQASLDLQIAIDDWPKLTKMFEQFGNEHQLSFRDAGENRRTLCWYWPLASAEKTKSTSRPSMSIGRTRITHPSFPGAE